MLFILHVYRILLVNYILDVYCMLLLSILLLLFIALHHYMLFKSAGRYRRKYLIVLVQMTITLKSLNLRIGHTCKHTRGGRRQQRC